jgi:hypothetical protein
MRNKLGLALLSLAPIGAAFLVWRIWTTPIFQGEVVTAPCHRDAPELKNVHRRSSRSRTARDPIEDEAAGAGTIPLSAKRGEERA